MESKNLLTLAITLTVGIILAGSLLMPVISDATETERTFTNSGLGEYRFIESTEDYKLEWTYADPSKVVINGTTVEAISGNTILAMGDFTVRMGLSTTTGYAQLIVANNESGITANVSDSRNFSFTYEAGTITITNGVTTKTLDSDGFYALVPENGTHTMKQPTDTVYLNANTSLMVMGLTGVGSQWNTGYLLDGTITNYTVEQWTGVTSYPATNVSDDSAKIDGYVDLYSVKKFTWDIDNNGTTQSVTYDYFIVPKEVTAELANHMTPGEIAIMNAIPVMIIVALVVMAAGALYLKRDD